MRREPKEVGKRGGERRGTRVRKRRESELINIAKSAGNEKDNDNRPIAATAGSRRRVTIRVATR